MILITILALLDPVNGDFFESLFKEHHTRVYQIAYDYVDNTEDAKDVVQDTFFKVYRNLALFQNKEKTDIIAMLVVCTRRVAIDLLRKKKRRIQAVSMVYEDDDGEYREYEIADSSQTPEEVIIRKEHAKQLGACVDLLPAAQREVILLKYRFDLKDRESAELLGITENAVALRVKRGKENLRKMVAEKTMEGERDE